MNLESRHQCQKHLILRNKRLFWGDRELNYQWGRSGLIQDKHEGDGGTPLGCFPFRRVYYRADRMPSISTHLPLQKLCPKDGWCDDPMDVRYNQHVTKPYPGRHEDLWREDEVYDVILVVGYNDNPIISGKGSAVFVHLLRTPPQPTEGCLALERQDLIQVLEESTLQTHLRVEQ